MTDSSTQRNPAAYAWLSVGAALTTLALKGGAAYVTGSVSLLSDALESIVNLVAAAGAVYALRIASKPADESHPHGHDKVEYFSSGFEGAMVLAAAAAIMVTAVPRLLAPRPIESLGVGLVISAVASAINFAVARALFSGGRRYHSITLEADGHHLMTDVWTSVGVIVAVGLVRVTGLDILDPIAAIVVAANIVRIGVSLVRRSMLGLMDTAIVGEHHKAIEDELAQFSTAHPVTFHALRTRESGSRRFIEVHVLVPGAWTVQRGHDLCEEIERRLRKLAPRTTVMTHLEPIEDPKSFQDQELDRTSKPD